MVPAAPDGLLEPSFTASGELALFGGELEAGRPLAGSVSVGLVEPGFTAPGGVHRTLLGGDLDLGRPPAGSLPGGLVERFLSRPGAILLLVVLLLRWG